jgi:hypothetical protein
MLRKDLQQVFHQDLAPVVVGNQKFLACPEERFLLPLDLPRFSPAQITVSAAVANQK